MILAFTLLVVVLSSYLNIMAIFCLLKKHIFDISNFTSADIVLLTERLNGKKCVISLILAVGTIELIL